MLQQIRLSNPFFILLLCFGHTAYAKIDQTRQIEYIGNPYKMKYVSIEDTYSRNVWDLQSYQGRLYIGAGNSANQGPSQNSGPLPLISYLPEKDKFINEGTIYDEQIDVFRVLDGKLFIPGHDATGSWNWGNFYVKDKNKPLKMYRNVPKALHLYDLALIHNTLYAAIGLDEGAAMGSTRDMGKHWKIQKLGRSRVYGLLPIDHTLFATKKFKRTSRPYFSVAKLQQNGQFSARYDLNIYKMFPDTVFRQKYARLIRAINLGKSAIYVGAYKYNDHQSKPFGLYTARLQRNRLAVKKINLGKGVIARDIIKRQNTLYVLATHKEQQGVNNMIFQAKPSNLRHWQKIISFHYPTFARSFELLKGYFYFGMGMDLNVPDEWKKSEMIKQTGDIVRLKTRRN